jgi:hypothetical protein
MADQCLFIRVEAYARQAPHKKNSRELKACTDGILGELVRRPGFHPHVAAPKQPEIIFGPDPETVWKEAYDQAAQAEERPGVRQRTTGLIMGVGVLTYPVPRSIVEKEPEETRKCESWFADSRVFIENEFGDRLKLIVYHRDETYPNWHFALIPRLGADRRIRIGDVHPGFRAEQEARARKESRRDQREAHEDALRAFIDRFHINVALKYGHCRSGPERGRLTRDEWKERIAMTRAFAVGQANFKREQEDAEAHLEHKFQEMCDEARKLAFEGNATAEAAASKKVDAIRQAATTRLVEMKSEIDEKSQLLTKQEERIRELELILEENGLTMNSPALRR